MTIIAHYVPKIPEDWVRFIDCAKLMLLQEPDRKIHILNVLQMKTPQIARYSLLCELLTLSVLACENRKIIERNLELVAPKPYIVNPPK